MPMMMMVMTATAKYKAKDRSCSAIMTGGGNIQVEAKENYEVDTQRKEHR